MAIEAIQGTAPTRRVNPQSVWQTPETDDLQQQLSQQMAMLMQAMQAFMQAVMQLLNQGGGQQGGGQGGGQQGVPGVGGGNGVPPAQQNAYAPPPQQQQQPQAQQQPPAPGNGPAPGAGTTPPGGTPATPPVGGATPPAGATPSSGGAPTNIPGVTLNAGGVPQAQAVEGVSPNANPDKVVQTGTGNDKFYNVTNATGREQSFTYSTNGVNKGTITLKPGETGAFIAGSRDLGVRISPSDANGNTHPNTVLYEDGGADNGQGAGVGNADISKVDGDLDYTGHHTNMTVTLSNGRVAGDGDPIHAYAFSTDDAASMGLAGDPSKTASIVLSDA